MNYAKTTRLGEPQSAVTTVGLPLSINGPSGVGAPPALTTEGLAPMARTSSQGRQPVTLAGRRVPGVFVYEKADGTKVFWLRLRIEDRPTWLTLDARNATEAAEAASVLRGDRAKGDLVAADRSITFERLLNEYLAQAAVRLSPGTFELYEARLQTYCLPVFRKRRVAEISTADVRRFLDQLRSGKIRGSRGVLAPSSQRGIMIALAATFRYARKQGIISRSPLTDLDSDDRPTSTRQRQPRYLAPAEIDRLLAEVGDGFRPALTVIAFSALRARECLGLRWQDIDFAANEINVNGSLARDGSGWVPTTKSKSSKASVPLLPRVARELKALRKSQAERGLHLVAPGALIFVTSNNLPQSPRNLLRAVYVASEKAKLNEGDKPRVCIHDLRHSAISISLDTLSLPEASRLARHGSVDITASTYSSVIEGRESQIGAKLAASGYGS
jgi:integrase